MTQKPKKGHFFRGDSPRKWSTFFPGSTLSERDIETSYCYSVVIRENQFENKTTK